VLEPRGAGASDQLRGEVALPPKQSRAYGASTRSLLVHSSSSAASPVIRGGYLPEMLTEEEAFEAMRHFLIAFWERGGSNHDSDVAELLRWTERDDWAGGPTFDPAQWHDWLAAVRKAEAGRRHLDAGS
jgi:hypothetical protein